MGNVGLWVGFNLAVLVLIGIDLGLTKHRGGGLTMKAAVMWTLGWVGLSLAFGGGIWAFVGATEGLQFFTGYVVEYALSVDNLFVFLMVFGYFKVRSHQQHRLLYWGIIGALIMRATLILVGTALVTRFHWVLYIFGAFLLVTAARMIFSGTDEEADPEQNKILKLAQRLLPVSRQQSGDHFFVRESGKLKVTRLFLILFVIELTDLLFALDSIPAVLGITQDPFLVYSSNVCAILGLRSLFFVVASLMDKFHFLKVGLAVVLAFVGLKMIGETFFHLDEQQKHWLIVGSLVFIALTLTVSILASMVRPPRPGPPAPRPG